jgi:thiol-disulfide isomerase/thioredoxin
MRKHQREWATRGVVVIFLVGLLGVVLWNWVGKRHGVGTIVWKTDVKGAMTEAKGSGKRVLVDFSATWCGPCQRMAEDVWPDGEVARVVGEKYVPVAVDIDSESGKVLARAYDVDAVPTVMVLDEGGKVVRQANGMDVEEVLAFLRR